MSERTVTYSPSFTVVPTRECFNRCGYCNFRADRGAWLSPAEAGRILEPLRERGVVEVLVLSGEVHPQDRRRTAWFANIADICRTALDLGFLPHTNCGILHFEEMQALQQVNCSLGLMLEICSEKLLETVHRHAPSKVPALRVQQLEWAGELGIPFTTGLLLGIGESPEERLETLETIAQIQRCYGHIQEVILQPHRPGSTQVWTAESFSELELLNLVRRAREILPESVVLQIPPNLVSDLPAFLEAGVRDLGGIGPVDVVNPDYDHPQPGPLARRLGSCGWLLRRRLPVYPPGYDRVSAGVRPVLEMFLEDQDWGG